MSDFKIGDKVTIHTSQGGPQSLATVTRFLANGKGMELSDGSQWRADGKRQFHYKGGFYKGPWVEPFSPGDDDHVAKRRHIGRLHKWARELTLESPLGGPALKRILDLIEAETKAATKEAE
ncbi:hypothetical protein [Azospirillum sp.]|uniref:hypothetical protein n=1 Tax=Azospirillum sp. TaxID=34012 RepID=UPI002D5353C9|nr:hypothetical protein [Azospirillum sp.]HYD64421.1 hypothetical protein [Azospirillum sp.]